MGVPRCAPVNVRRPRSRPLHELLAVRLGDLAHGAIDALFLERHRVEQRVPRANQRIDLAHEKLGCSLMARKQPPGREWLEAAMRSFLCSLLVVTLSTCATARRSRRRSRRRRSSPRREEVRFEGLRQLTFEGENAGRIGASTARAPRCSAARGRVRTAIASTPSRSLTRRRAAANPTPEALLERQGATACALPAGDQEIPYASTHLGGDACPPKPDMRLGYVWRSTTRTRSSRRRPTAPESSPS